MDNLVKLPIPEVNTCCGCSSLENGVKIIAFSHAILSGAAMMYLVAEEIDHFYRYIYKRGYYVENAPGSLVYFTDIGVTLHFLFAIYLLQGIYYKKSYYLMSWIILQISTVIVGIFMLVIAILAIFTSYLPNNIKSIQLEFERLIIGVIFSFLSCYTVVVVHSYYRVVDKMKPEHR